jgi:hypothetical protein
MPVAWLAGITKLLICYDALMNVSALPLANVLFTAVAVLNVCVEHQTVIKQQNAEHKTALGKFRKGDLH